MIKYALVIICLMMIGCASKGVLPIYTNIPESCEGLKNEMFELDAELQNILGQRTIKNTAIVGTQLAVGAGTIAPAFAIAPIVLESIRYDDGERLMRIEHLAKISEMRRCKL